MISQLCTLQVIGFPAEVGFPPYYANLAKAPPSKCVRKIKIKEILVLLT